MKVTGVDVGGLYSPHKHEAQTTEHDVEMEKMRKGAKFCPLHPHVQLLFSKNFGLKTERVACHICEEDRLAAKRAKEEERLAANKALEAKQVLSLERRKAETLKNCENCPIHPQVKLKMWVDHTLVDVKCKLCVKAEADAQCEKQKEIARLQCEK